MMREVFGSLSGGQQDQVKDWIREQIGLNDFNCSMAPGPQRPGSMAQGSWRPGKGRPRAPGEMLNKHHVCECVLCA